MKRHVRHTIIAAAALILLAELLIRWPHRGEPIELYVLVGDSVSAQAFSTTTVSRFSGATHLGHLSEVASSALQPSGASAPIGEVHSRGLLHRGIWLAVLNHAGQLLLLRRSSRTVTCPSAWSLVGEHCQPGEPATDTAQRALREELGLASEAQRQIAIERLGPDLLFKSDYSVDGGLAAGSGRVKQDLQVTTLLVATLPARTPRFTFGDEVSETRWIRVESVGRWANSSGAKELCNAPIRELLFVVLRRLRQHVCAKAASHLRIPARNVSRCSVASRRVPVRRANRTRVAVSMKG